MRCSTSYVSGVFIERYCALLDSGEREALLELFDDDCTFAMMGQNYCGREELAKVWSRLQPTDRPATLHAVVTPLITVHADRASAVTGWMLLDRSGPQGSTAIALAGRYIDELTKRDGDSWRFSRRQVQTLARPQP